MYFIVNPGAGRGRGRKALERLRPLLGAEDVVAISQGPGHCEQLAREAVEAGQGAIAVVGGDGSVGEAINGIAAMGFQASLGVLPVGTGNDFAASLGIPADPEGALAILRAGQFRQVDVGLVISGDVRRYFVTTAGAGVNAVIARLAQSETAKAVGSPITYVPIALRELLRFRPIEVEIGDDQLIYRGRIVQMSVSNCPTEGGIFWLAPGARPDDGFLHLLILGNVPVWQRPWYALQCIRGKPDAPAKAQRQPIKRVTLRGPDDLPFYVDGDFLPLVPGKGVEIRVEERRLRAIAPQAQAGIRR